MIKSFSKMFLVFFVSFGLIGNTIAATTPSLGTAATYGVLAGTYTNTAAGTINGDVGYTTPPAVFPTINGTTVVPKSPQAGTDQGLALAAINIQSCDFTFTTATDLSLLPQPLTPGVYCITAAASIGSSGIILHGNGTYIFKISGAFNTVANSVVSLSGGASACDVFWTPTSATTLGANSIFIGTVINDAGITVGDNVVWQGRALSFATTVTTNNSTISVPTCTVIVSPPLTQSIHVVKTVNRSTPFPYGGGNVLYTYVVTTPDNSPINNVVITDDKCSPLTFMSGDINNDSILDTNEARVYTCSDTILVSTTNIATVTGEANGFIVFDTDSANVLVAGEVGAAVIQVDSATVSAQNTTNSTNSPTVIVATESLPMQSINIVKRVNRSTPLPYEGGNVIYVYIVSNPNNSPISTVVIADNTCSPLTFISGDLDNDTLLDTDEAWVYTCSDRLFVSTTNIATVAGKVNGVTVFDTDSATVLVDTYVRPTLPVIPKLPKTGFSYIPWYVSPRYIAITIYTSIVFLLMFVVRAKKRR